MVKESSTLRTLGTMVNDIWETVKIPFEFGKSFLQGYATEQLTSSSLYRWGGTKASKKMFKFSRIFLDKDINSKINTPTFYDYMDMYCDLFRKGEKPYDTLNEYLILDSEIDWPKLQRLKWRVGIDSILWSTGGILGIGQDAIAMLLPIGLIENSDNVVCQTACVYLASKIFTNAVSYLGYKVSDWYQLAKKE